MANQYTKSNILIVKNQFCFLLVILRGSLHKKFPLFKGGISKTGGFLSVCCVKILRLYEPPPFLKEDSMVVILSDSEESRKKAESLVNPLLIGEDLGEV